MKETIKNQISSEILKQICVLESERNQEKQKLIAQGIIEELNVEDFTPYMAYNDEGNIFIAMNYYYSSNGIEEALLSEKHDVAISSEGVYIEDESYLAPLKKERELNNQIKEEELRAEQKKEIKNQKRYDEISEKLEFLLNQLQNLVNFERPLCVGNYKKITEIDEKIANLENRIENLEKELEELEK